MPNLAEVQQMLRARFQESLRTKMLVLEELGDALGEREEAETQVRRLAHQIRGSAGSFGFPVLSLAAEHMEHCHPSNLPDTVATTLALMADIIALGVAFHTRILIVEDDDPTYELLERTLVGTGRELSRSASLGAARASLEARRFDVVILDLALPDGDGAELLLQIQSDPFLLRPVVFVVSALGDGHSHQELLALGARRVFVKPLNLGVFSVEFASELALFHQVAAQSQFDASTGLFNKNGLSREWVRLLARWDRRGPIAVALIARSPPSTDASPLRALAERIAARLESDEVLVGRWSEDELVVCLSSSTVEDVSNRLSVEMAALPSWSFGCVEVREILSMQVVVNAARRELLGMTPGSEGAELGSAPIDILVVEDDPYQADFVVAILRNAGMSVESVGNLEDARLELSSWPYRVVVLDRGLGTTDGLHLLRELRASETTTRVCILSAAAHVESLEDAFEFGADEYVTKPFEPRELVARLRRLLQR